MIVKSLGRKERCFGKLARYIDNGAEQGIVISRNLSVGSSDRAAVVAAFEANADYLSPRRRGNWCYHDIIALPEHAGSLADKEVMLRDLAETYLSLRAPDQLAYGRLHIKTPKPHIHLMISANTVASPRRARPRRQAFPAARLQPETYKLERWPKLTERLFGHDSYNRYLSGVKEEAVRRRTGRGTKREELAARLSGIFTATKWWDELSAKLLGEGLKLYRRGKTWGVVDQKSGRKHRLQKLGLEQDWSELQGRMSVLHAQLQPVRDTQAQPDKSRLAGQGRERVRDPQRS